MSDKKSAPAPVVELFTLDALAKMFSQVAKPCPDGDKYKADHSSAAAVHGWNKYEYDHPGKLMISISDYVESLKAARTGKVHAPCNKRIRKA